MRRLILSAIAAALVASLSPAQAGHTLGHWTDVSFNAAIPCQVYCAYWLEDANTDLDGDGLEDVFFNACKAPFPDGSYDDVVVTAPAGARLLTFQIFPLLDWDSFVCSKPASGNNGDLLATGANAIGDACDGILGPGDLSGTGCVETVAVEAIPGRRYVLRAYNWQDLPDLSGRYQFRG